MASGCNLSILFTQCVQTGRFITCAKQNWKLINYCQNSIFLLLSASETLSFPVETCAIRAGAGKPRAGQRAPQPASHLSRQANRTHSGSEALAPYLDPKTVRLAPRSPLAPASTPGASSQGGLARVGYRAASRSLSTTQPQLRSASRASPLHAPAVLGPG